MNTSITYYFDLEFWSLSSYKFLINSRKHHKKRKKKKKTIHQLYTCIITMRACVENNPTFCLFWRILLFKFLQVWKLLWKIDQQIIKDIITLIFCKIKNKKKEKTKHQKTYIGDIFVWKIFFFYFALLLIVTIIIPNPFYIDVLSELFDNIWIPLL